MMVRAVIGRMLRPAHYLEMSNESPRRPVRPTPFCIEHDSLVVAVSPFSPFTPVIAFLNDGDRP